MIRCHVLRALVLAVLSLPTAALSVEYPGAIPARFAVGNQGEASYSIPVQTPAGTGGMRPSLALTYNHLAGDGLAGMRWQLSGFSSISRCQQTYAQDGQVNDVSYDSADRFCLDGQRLVDIGASEFRTEIETFQRIKKYGTAGSGPQYFTVEHGNGLKSYYGYTTDSRIEKVGASDVRIWFISYTEDQFGNQVNYYYSENTSTGEAVPTEVRWTNNSAQGLGYKYKAVITYETRPTDAQRSGYDSGGAKWARTKRIDYITVTSLHSGTQEIAKYDLSYTTPASTGTGRSQLSQVTLCRGYDCLPETLFDLQDGTRNWGSLVNSGKDSGSDPLLGDFDNDGKSDLYVSLNGTWQVYKGNASGLLDTAINSSVASTTNPDKARLLDYNGDGKSDLLYQSSGTWYVLKSNGTGFDSAVSTGVSTSSVTEATIRDFDGDGLGDWLYMSGGDLKWRRNLGNSSFAAVQTILTSLQGGTWDEPVITAADFNGDGRDDLVNYQSTYQCDQNWYCWEETTFQILVASGSSYSVYASYFNLFDNVWAIDLNGDGLDDLLYEQTGASTLRTRLNTGSGFAAAVDTGITDVNASRAIIVDYDNDGREDYLRPDSTYWYVYRSTGALPSSYSDFLVSSGASSTDAFVADLSGDGFAEIIRPYVNQWRTHKHNSDLPDVVTTFEDGLGYAIDVTYESLSNTASDHYNFDASDVATAPYQRQFRGSRYVVTHEDHSDGIGGTRSFRHRYDTAHIDVSGRGWLSFDWHDVFDLDRGLDTTTWFWQTWPRVGRPLQVTTNRTSPLSTVQQTNHTVSYSVLGATTPSRYFVRTENSTIVEKEVGGTENGNEIRTTVIDPTFNGTYGYLESRTVTVTDPSDTYTWSTSTNYNATMDTDDWCLGLPGLVTTTKTAPGSTSQTRKLRHYWNASTCRLTETRDESETSTAKQLKTTFTFDAYGNPDVISTDSVNGAAQNRSIDYGFDAWGQCLTSQTIGTVSLTTTSTCDYLTGQPASVTGPDGLSTSYLYDSFGRLEKETFPGGYTDYSYAACGTCWASNAVMYMLAEGSDGSDSYEYLDELQRTVGRSRTLPLGTEGRIETRYDSNGFVEKETRPYVSGASQYWVEYDFDLIGRLTDVREPTGTGTAYTSYDYLADEVDVTAPDSETTKTYYNAAGQIAQVTDAANYSTTYAYYPFGELKSITDPESNVTNLSYDARGFKTTLDDPNYGANWTYDYDVYGQLYTQTSPIDQGSGASVTLTYDEAGRIKTRVESEGTTSWGYYTTGTGKKGRVSTVSGPGHSIYYEYSATYGSPTLIRETLDGTAYDFNMTYTSAGKLDILTYPVTTSSYRFKVNYDYDVWGNMTLAKDGNTGAAFWTLKEADAFGHEVWSEFGNGLDELRTYNQATGRLATIETGTTKGATGVQDLEFEWTIDGNLWKRHNYKILETETLVYDEVDRLTQSQVTGETAVNINYSAAGRITSKSDAGGTFTYGAGSAGPYAVTSANGMSYTYDANGRMITRGSDAQTWYTYDLPKVLKKGSTTATFSYGVDRARYKQVQSGGPTIYYVGGLFEKEVGGSTTYRHYAQAGGRVVAMMERVGTTNTLQYLHRDHQGSVVEVTSSSGSVVQSLAFDAWGLRRDPTDWSPLTSPFGGTQETERGYTGHEHIDSIGLIHMNGRVQDPVLGRFMSADPFIQAPYNAQSLNRYSYVWNNPLRFTDPSGFCNAERAGARRTDNGNDAECEKIAEMFMPEIFVYGQSGGMSYGQYEQWAQNQQNGTVGGDVTTTSGGNASDGGNEYSEEIVVLGSVAQSLPRFRSFGIPWARIGSGISAPIIAFTLLFTPTTMGDATLKNEEASDNALDADDRASSSDDARQHSPDQQALNDLINDLTLGGRKPLSDVNADTILDWASELGIRVRDDRGTDHWSGGNHIHVPGSGITHIPTE